MRAKSLRLFVRDSAIDGLKDRRREDFIPQWMSMMRTPVTTELQRVNWGRHQGLLCLFRRERDFEIEVGQLLVWAPNSSRRVNGPRDRAVYSSYQRRVELLLRDRLRNAERASSAQADNDEQTNERIAEALRTITQQKLGDAPQGWWDWWQEQSGFSSVPASAKRRVVIVKEENQVRVPPPPPVMPSCLVAGTPIWTEYGQVAIERIQTGDRVLSKNIETGELAYKVVLHTTVREPFPVTKFTVGDEAILATAGHHFWVSGQGWTKTRELAAEQPLHTPTGVLRIDSTASAEKAPTYNLVVADFHTYFVGKNAILSHDVLPPKPTNTLVPGLSDD